MSNEPIPGKRSDLVKEARDIISQGIIDFVASVLSCFVLLSFIVAFFFEDT